MSCPAQYSHHKLEEQTAQVTVSSLNMKKWGDKMNRTVNQI
jgi:hypothetical protein